MVSGIRYSYSNGGSVDIKYPKQRQGFADSTVNGAEGTWSGGQGQGSQLGLTTDQTAIDYGKPQVDNTSALSVNPSGTSTANGATGQPGQASNYQQVQATQAPQQSAGTGAGGLIGGIVDDVVGIFGVGQNAANAEQGRNIARKQLSMNEATTAENLRGAGQARQQSAITFGENQAQRGVATAWATGVAKGLTTGRT